MDDAGDVLRTPGDIAPRWTPAHPSGLSPVEWSVFVGVLARQTKTPELQSRWEILGCDERTPTVKLSQLLRCNHRLMLLLRIDPAVSKYHRIIREPPSPGIGGSDTC